MLWCGNNPKIIDLLRYMHFANFTDMKGISHTFKDMRRAEKQRRAVGIF